MALIGEIRKRSWILIVMIALGLGGFLVMDMVNANQGPGGGMSQLTMGEIDGTEIGRTEFERTYGLRYSGSTAPSYQNREILWNWYVENHVLSTEAEALGFGVSAAEIKELEFGTNPSPIIRQNFSNPQQPGSVNRQLLNEYQNIIETEAYQTLADRGMDPQQFIDFWKMQREMIVKERLQSKLVGLISKGMYTPNWMAEMAFNEEQFMDFTYVKVPYDQIPNEDVSLTDSDLADYLTANSTRFMRKQEQRRLDYVVFDVLPTAADSAIIRDSMISLVNTWRTTTDTDSNFVLRQEYGNISPFLYDSTQLQQVTAVAADTLLAAPAGTIYGPYIENGEYRIAKVLERQVLADSADVRHILLSATTEADFATADVRADSLIGVLESGAAVFDSLVVNFSQDPGSSSNGGKYENVVPNQMVPEFNEVLFVTGDIGPLYKVRTDYGIHIMEVLSRTSATSPRASLAVITQPIVPSKETQDGIYERASEFVATNRDLSSLRSAADQAADLRLVSSPELGKNDYIIGQLGYGDDTRNMVCWAYSADEGDVSPTVYSFSDQQRFYDNKYVVIGLRDILEPGLPEVAEIRDDIELEVMKQKKGEDISSRINGTDLASIAGQFGVTVDTVTNIAFSQTSHPALGVEPKVVAMAQRTAQGSTTAPIIGEDGVFVLQITRKAEPGQATNLPQLRQRINTRSRSQVSQYLMQFMRETVDVADNRATFECN